MGILPKKTKTISKEKLLGLSPSRSDDRTYLRYEKLLKTIHYEMLKKGMSGNRLAQLMGVSRQAIYDRFSGKNTSLEWIIKVAELLGMKVLIQIKPSQMKAA